MVQGSKWRQLAFYVETKGGKTMTYGSIDWLSVGKTQGQYARKGSPIVILNETKVHETLKKASKLKQHKLGFYS